MSKAEQAGEVVAEIVEETIEAVTETPTAVEAQIAVAKAEATVQRAEDAVAIIEQTAQIQVAQIAIDAEQQIAEHEEKVVELEYDLKWQNETIKSLQVLTENLALKMEQMESKLSTPTVSQSEMTAIPETVAIVENVVLDDQAEQPENPVQEIVEQVMPQKAARKIRAL